MENLSTGSLQIKMGIDGDKNKMEWIGKSEDRAPATMMNPYFEGLIDKLKGKELIVEFRQLEYMNSSTVPPIIHLIKNLESNSIQTLIIYNKNSKWQAASFKALEIISTTMKSISVKGQ